MIIQAILCNYNESQRMLVGVEEQHRLEHVQRLVHPHPADHNDNNNLFLEGPAMERSVLLIEIQSNTVSYAVTAALSKFVVL